MASGSKRWLHDQVRRLQGQRTRSDPAPEPLILHDNPLLTEATSTQGAPVEAGQAMSARKAILGGLRDSLVKLPWPKTGSLTRFQTDMRLSLRDEVTGRDMDDIIKHLSPVHDAYYNAALPTSVTKRVGCTPGTRVQLLETAQDWAHGGNPAKIYWLNGMAGTGKTTIAYTLCEMLQKDKLLGASFFCSRNSADCQDVNRVVPTIAYQLAQCSNLYRQEVLRALKRYSDVSRRDIGAQFRHLISEPFAKISQTTSKVIIVVIDALDECADEAGTKVVLDLLIRHAANLPIKLFIASRPEPTISHSMESRDGTLRSIFWLHDIEESLVQADIKLYLTEALASINVSPSEIDQLASRAGNLFIFAATTVRYILPDRGAVNQRQRLQAVLKLRPSQKHRSHQDIDDLYGAILANALDENVYEEEEVTTRQQVLKAVICAKEPLTILALAQILRVPDEEDVLIAIHPLQSLLYVSAVTNAVSALHASFPDFLLSNSRAGQFYYDQALQNSCLAERCFGLMRRSLKFNICELESAYLFDRDVSDLQSRVDAAIPTGLFYACRYWGDHLTSGPPSPALRVLLDTFFQQHLLFWMEVLNLKGRVGHGEVVLSQVLTWLPMEDEWTVIRDFAYDARNFVTSFAANPVSLSTPHIYVSVLPFTSKESRVRMTYWERTRDLIEIEGAATGDRGNSALATWIVGGMVNSIAQSSDGMRVASGSDKNEVSIWDVSSGARILGPLRGHKDQVHSVAFSSDNSRIVSGSEDGTIRIWDAHNGNLVLGPLRGHTSGVLSVALSPDGTRLASGSKDHTIRMWDVHTGAAIGDTYGGHRDVVCSVVFSPDGKHLASGSSDHTIRVWNWREGLVALRPMKGHTGSVKSVAYSPDGLRLASGSSDFMVLVWDMSNGTLLAGPFRGHTCSVTSVSFSPNGTQIVSGSRGFTIRVWEAESGKLLAGPFHGHSREINGVLFTADVAGGTLVTGPLKGHTGEVTSVAFSPDDARIVSGSDDCTLRTWDASTGALFAGPFRGHSGSVNSVTFSPDGSQVASGSHDRTIRLWDSYTSKSIGEPFRGHSHYITSIAFSPNGTRIVSGSYDKTVRVWGANGTPLWTSNLHSSYVNCVAFSPNGMRVVSGSDDRAILVLDASDGAVLHGPFTGHTSWAMSVAFSPGGTRVVSGSRDRTVRVWDVESGTVIVGPLKGHTNEVRSVAFSPDGARIISASIDGTIRFWDVAAAAQPNAASFDGWSIDDDGWLTNSQSQRLFWVPSDLRDGFWFPTPSNPAASNPRSTTRVDSTTLLGDQWHECYDASL